MILSQKLNEHFDSWEQNLWPILYDLGGHSDQTFKGCIDYELKFADNPYVCTI